MNLKQVGSPLWRERTLLVSNRRRHRHEEDRDHGQRDHEFADHPGEIAEQTPPARFARSDHSFASDEFARDRADYGTDEQANKSEEKSDKRADDGAECPPFGRTEIFCAEIAAKKIERIGREGKQNENADHRPTDTSLRAEHHAMNDRTSQNDGGPRENRHNRAD